MRSQDRTSRRGLATTTTTPSLPRPWTLSNHRQERDMSDRNDHDDDGNDNSYGGKHTSHYYSQQHHNFMSSPPNSAHFQREHAFVESFAIDNRARTPMYDLPPQNTPNSLRIPLQEKPNTTTPNNCCHTPNETPVDSQEDLIPPPHTIHNTTSEYTTPSSAGDRSYSPSTIDDSNRSSPVPHISDILSEITSPEGYFSQHSQKSSESLLFGEEISLTTSARKTSMRSRNPTTTRSNGSSAMSSPFETDFLEDVELQQPQQILRKNEKTPVNVLEDLSTIGGPNSTCKRVHFHISHNSPATPRLSPQLQQASLWAKTEIQLAAHTVSLSIQRCWHHLCPARPKTTTRLEYLIEAHRSKMRQLTSFEHDDHFDFAVVLLPQEVYAFWAELLDFREEQLGEAIAEEGGASPLSPHSTDDTALSEEDSTETPDGQVDDGSPQQTTPLVLDMSTPLTGIHQRRKAAAAAGLLTNPTSFTTPTSAPMTRSRKMLLSPYCLGGDSDKKPVQRRLSVFERAIGPLSPANHSYASIAAAPNTIVDSTSKIKVESTPSTARRRWGPQQQNQSAATMMSPPIRSLTRGANTTVGGKRSSRIHQPQSYVQQHHQQQQQHKDDSYNDDFDQATQGGPRRHDPNTLRIEDIPTQVIPRGIAARTNGLLQFLSALKRGVVVRRHLGGQEATFCKVYSNDGGDTIQFKPVEPEVAMLAFKEQRIRYNRFSKGYRKRHAQRWSYENYHDDDENSINSSNRHFSVPDFIAARQFREKMNREQNLSNRVANIVKKVTRSGQFRAGDMVAVHPSTHEDPRSSRGEQGTASLRRSKSLYDHNLTFSIVSTVAQHFRGGQAKKENFASRWYSGEGTDVLFRCFDFEAATEGEYWLLFRGFLLLHRDAAAGRFALHRAAGIGSHVNRLEMEHQGSTDLDQQNILHRDEFHEPVTPSCMEKMIVKLRKIDTTYMEGFCLPGAVPPPSDYFLGFRSPGTQIWSRLRQAGFETHRIYSLDRKRVMIKVRCPTDRLMDVAEVLRLKLKTRDGGFAPFQEDALDIYQPSDPEELTCKPGTVESLFRSSHRQTIVDFILGSRIRDSGAELGQTTDLGKKILAMVPLHVPEKLNALYNSWYYFWQRENWNGRDGRSLRVEKSSVVAALYPNRLGSTRKIKFQEEIEDSERADEPPNFFVRFFVGSFFQPLDSIEEYFGEKIAFYFAWLQHCAVHLTVLTIAGLIVLVCMLLSDNADHPIRPIFSIFIMLWSFVVLVNWRKRSNFLAYRWGTIDYKEQETTRPEFRGKYARDEITQEWVVTYPRWKRWLKYTISLPLTVAFTFGSLLIILMVHANRDLLLAEYISSMNSTDAPPFAIQFSIENIGLKAPVTEVPMKKELFFDKTFLILMCGFPLILGVSLPLMNFILMNVSYLLNDFENYRTHSEYRTHLIIKVFSFRFVCYFGSLYYYAFVGTGSPQAIYNGIVRVGSGLLMYTTIAHWWTIFLQVYFPLLVRRVRMRHRRRRLQDELERIEAQEDELIEMAGTGSAEDEKKRQIELINQRLLLDQAQDDLWYEAMLPAHDSFPEYITAVVQFTYVTCFSVVLPITPLIVLINYLVAMRLDAYKVCRGRRRPLAKKTGGIGVWEHLLHIVVVISVLTNCWLMGFTHSNFVSAGKSLGNVGQFAAVVGWEHVMLLIKYVFHAASSSLPQSVKDDMKKEQHRLARERNFSMQAKKRRSQFAKEPNDIFRRSVAVPNSEAAFEAMRILPSESTTTRLSEC